MPSSASLWPHDQNFLDQTETAELLKSCEQVFCETLAEHRLRADLVEFLPKLYLPLAAWIDKLFLSRDGTLVIALCGAQGSGKSTTTALLAKVLSQGFGRKVTAFSIDDIYKTRASREKLAQKVHPLFMTRGVPGTHDVGLGIDTIHRLKSMGEGDECKIPVFDKAQDDRKPETEWPRVSGSIDIILFEGWCVGALPERESALQQPINSLERNEDETGQWRQAVNEALAAEYTQLFGLIDSLMMLKVSGMDKVFEWRRLQEHKLRQQVVEAEKTHTNLKVMSDAEVDRFIMHYERTTRHILKEMPSRADVIFELDDSHSAHRVKINRSLS